MRLLLLAACSTDTENEPAAAPEAAALAALEAGPAADKRVEAVRIRRARFDALGFHHTHVQQLVADVPVFGAEAIVHFDPAGALTGITDDLVADVVVDTVPTIDEADAIERAVGGTVGWEGVSAEPLADLWVLRHEGVDHLAWRVQIEAIHFGSGDTVPVIFVDAHTGDLVWGYDNFQTAACSGTTNYYGAVTLDCYHDGTDYYLEDTTDLLATYSWANTTTGLYYVSSTTGVFDSADYLYVNAVEAQYGSTAVDDYYAVAHGRNGIDGAGGPGAITSHGYNFITSSTSYSTNYANAFWSTTNLWMVYGDGDGSAFSSLTTLDIAGHEMTHGVTQYESNLTYSGESGHLNESMSDVFGAMVERSILTETADTWLIGEEARTPGTEGDALRYMNDPANDGVSWDYYSSSIGTVDVHYGSGVGNLAFYLLSEGGSHPQGKSTTVVTAIGADDAADIWYLANSSYMTSSTNYLGARTATLSAASALYGATSTQYTAVGDAWTAVGVAAAPACATSTYSASLSKKKTGYQPSSSGTSVTVATQTLALTGPASSDFDLYLQKKGSRSSWSTVASDTGSSVNKSISYTGTSGTYRVSVSANSGSGTYSLSWCK